MATPYMNLSLPTPSVSAGPGWATTLNTALTTVDAHNHTTGQGVAITTAALNINADLTFAGYNATTLRSVRFSDQASPLAVATDASCVYSSGGDLYWNNGSGTSVQITSGTALSATSLGGISGLASTTGSASYSAGAGTFSWRSNTNVAATMDSGPLVVRDVAASALGITVKSPTSLAAAYSLTLPTALPVSSKLVLVSSAGAMSYGDVDGTTLVNSSGTFSVGTIARANMYSVGQQVSSSCGTVTTSSTSFVDVTNLSVTITVHSRLVMLMMVSDGSGTGADLRYFNSGGLGQTWTAQLTRDGSAMAQFSGIVNGTTTQSWSPTFLHVDSTTAGSHTYKVQFKVSSGTGTLTFINWKLVAFEL